MDLHTSLAVNTTAFGSHVLVPVIASSSINIILGLPLNSYVVWLILGGARETLASDFFSLNLAVTEILIILSCTWYFVFQVNMSLWLCFEAFMFSSGLFYTARPLFQTCMCVECYIGIVHPVLFLRFKPLRYRAACSCVVWLISLVSCIYQFHTYSNPQYLYGSFIQNFVFFSVMLFCYLSIVMALKRPAPGEKAAEKGKTNAMKRRAVKIVFLITLSLFVNFVLYLSVIPFQSLLRERFPNTLTITTGLALTTGFSQPLLYLHRNGKLLCFRKP